MIHRNSQVRRAASRHDNVPGHKRSRRLIEAEAYRRITSGELQSTLNEFAVQLLNWFRQTYPNADHVGDDRE